MSHAVPAYAPVPEMSMIIFLSGHVSQEKPNFDTFGREMPLEKYPNIPQRVNKLNRV